jgi:hypothetical protein
MHMHRDFIDKSRWARCFVSQSPSSATGFDLYTNFCEHIFFLFQPTVSFVVLFVCYSLFICLFGLLWCNTKMWLQRGYDMCHKNNANPTISKLPLLYRVSRFGIKIWCCCEMNKIQRKNGKFPYSDQCRKASMQTDNKFEWQWAGISWKMCS